MVGVVAVGQAGGRADVAGGDDVAIDDDHRRCPPAVASGARARRLRTRGAAARVEQRADATAVPGEKKLLGPFVPYGQSELAVEMPHAVGAVLLVEFQDYFCVGVGAEVVALG